MFLIYSLIMILFSISIFKFASYYNIALDKDFSKPQAIHKLSKPRILGLPVFAILVYLFISKHLIFVYFLLVLFSIICSFPGLLDDFGINIRPSLRFIFQALFISSLFFLSDSLNPIDKLDFLPSIFDNYIFLNFFTIFAILTIANSFNFMDGCNGLIILYSLLIFFVLLTLSNNYFLSIFCILLIIYLTIILFFNFPNAKAFLGDFGAYFLGFILSFLVIYVSNNKDLLNFDLNEWFFATLFLYPSFEIFTTITRRLISLKSPFYPDNLHFHSILYRLLASKFGNKEANYSTSLIIFLINILILISLFFIPINYYYLNYLIGFALFFLLRSFLKNKLFKLGLQK